MKESKTDEAAMKKKFCAEKPTEEDVKVMRQMHDCMKKNMKKPSDEDMKNMRDCHKKVMA